MREFAVAALGEKAADAEVTMGQASVAHPEHDVAGFQDLPAPAIPASHMRRDDDRRHPPLLASLRCLGPVVIPLKAGRGQPLAHLGFMRGVEKQSNDPSKDSAHVGFASNSARALLGGFQAFHPKAN